MKDAEHADVFKQLEMEHEQANESAGRVLPTYYEDEDGNCERAFDISYSLRNDKMREALANYAIGTDGHVIRFGEPAKHTTDFYEFTDYRDK